jgi:hypothetical protein
MCVVFPLRWFLPVQVVEVNENLLGREDEEGNGKQRKKLSQRQRTLIHPGMCRKL